MANRMEAPSHGVSRREAIRRAALAAGVALSPAWLTFVDRRTTPVQNPYLTPGQMTLLSAVVDRIIPRTDTPGAVDVGVPIFIDVFYGECLTEEERQLLASGLEVVERASVAAHGAAFATLGSAQQDAVLRAIAGAEAGRDQESFRLLRSVTVLGYFTSEEAGRTILHYDPVPGRYEACLPISEVGNRNWTT